MTKIYTPHVLYIICTPPVVYNSTEFFHQLTVLNLCKQEHPFPVSLPVLEVICRLWVSPRFQPAGKRNKQGHALSVKELLWHFFLHSLPATGLLMRNVPEEGQNGPRALFF